MPYSMLVIEESFFLLHAIICKMISLVGENFVNHTVAAGAALVFALLL